MLKLKMAMEEGMLKLRCNSTQHPNQNLEPLTERIQTLTAVGRLTQPVALCCACGNQITHHIPKCCWGVLRTKRQIPTANAILAQQHP